MICVTTGTSTASTISCKRTCDTVKPEAQLVDDGGTKLVVLSLAIHINCTLKEDKIDPPVNNRAVYVSVQSPSNAVAFEMGDCDTRHSEIHLPEAETTPCELVNLVAR